MRARFQSVASSVASKHGLPLAPAFKARNPGFRAPQTSQNPAPGTMLKPHCQQCASREVNTIVGMVAPRTPPPAGNARGGHGRAGEYPMWRICVLLTKVTGRPPKAKGDDDGPVATLVLVSASSERLQVPRGAARERPG